MRNEDKRWTIYANDRTWCLAYRDGWERPEDGVFERPGETVEFFGEYVVVVHHGDVDDS